MRHYTAEDERRIRLQTTVRAWAAAGLVDAQQAAAIGETLRTDLKRTKGLLRAALAAFTALIVAAAVGLVFVSFNIHGDAETALVLALAALGCFAAADYLAGTLRLYRYGVEETLAVLSPIFLSIATVSLANSGGRTSFHVDMLAALVVGAAAALVVYLRFGLVYAGVAAIICIGLVPSQFALSLSSERICAAAIFGAVFFVARASYRNHGDDFPGDDYSVFEAAASAGAYLSLNIHAWNAIGSWLWNVPVVSIDRWFYWGSYAATWAIPAAALADAIRAKDRALLRVGIALSLVTLATNKSYLGVPRQTWDPMILGAVLVGVAVGVRRWLAAGPAGRRDGYTSERILDGDRDLLATAANVSVAWHGRAQAPAPADPTPSPFGGGRSGGGGGGASY